MYRSDFDYLTKLFFRRQVKVKSLMKTLTLYMIVNELAQACLVVTTKYLEWILGSQTRGPHVAREGILCSPRCF